MARSPKASNGPGPSGRQRKTAEVAAGGWVLPPRRLSLIALPLLVFALINLIASLWGSASLQLAQPFSPGDGHLEAAGRISTLAAFLLFVAVGGATLIYAARIAGRIEPKSRARLLAAYALTAAVGTIFILAMGVQKGNPYLEASLPCVSLAQLDPGATGPAAPKPPRVTAREIERRCAMTGSSIETGPLAEQLFPVPAARFEGDPYPIFRILYAAAAILLFLAIPAAIWAAIACVAMPTTGSPKARLDAWRQQTERLNVILYLTAGLMVAALLFSNSLFSWTAYSLHPDDLKSFREHSESLVFYAGVSNSILIASYYLPVAAALAELRPDLPAEEENGKGTEKGKDADAKAADPFAAFKTILTILAPAIIGLAGELIKFSG